MTRVIVKLNNENENINIINSKNIKLLKVKNGLKSDYLIKKPFNFDRVYSEHVTFKTVVNNEMKIIMSESFITFFYETDEYNIFHKDGMLKLFSDNLKESYKCSCFEVVDDILIDLFDNNKKSKITIKNNVTVEYKYKEIEIKSKNNILELINKISKNKSSNHLIFSFHSQDKIYTFVILRDDNIEFKALINCIKALNANKNYIPYNKTPFTMIFKNLKMRKWNSIFFINIYHDSDYVNLINFAASLINNHEKEKEKNIFSDLFSYIDNFFPLDNINDEEDNGYEEDNEHEYDEIEFEDDEDEIEFEDDEYELEFEDDEYELEFEDDGDEIEFEDDEYEIDKIEYDELISDEDKDEEKIYSNTDLRLIKSLNIKGESLFIKFHILFKHIFMEMVKINSMIEENAKMDDYSDINEKLLVKAISLKNYLIVMLNEMLKL